MIDKFATSITDALLDNGIVNSDERDIYEYGINLILSGFAGGLIIIILSLVIGRLEFGVMFLGVIIPVRMYTGGYHADTHMMCNVVFSIVYIFSVVLYEWLAGVNLQKVIWIATIISVVLIAFMAPLENSNKPITNEEKKKYKIISVCMCLILCAIVKLFEKQYCMILYMNVVLVMIALLLIAGIFKEIGLHK